MGADQSTTRQEDNSTQISNNLDGSNQVNTLNHGMENGRITPGSFFADCQDLLMIEKYHRISKW